MKPAFGKPARKILKPATDIWKVCDYSIYKTERLGDGCFFFEKKFQEVNL